MVSDAKPTKRIAAEVQARVASGKCLCCDKTGRRRGLCDTCYHSWYMNRMRMDAQNAAAFDARLIRAGRLLPAGTSRRLRRQNVFDRFASQIAG